MNVLIMPPHLVHSALYQIKTYLHVCFVINFDTSACFGSCSKIRKRNVTIVIQLSLPTIQFSNAAFLWSGTSVGNIVMKA